MKPVELLAAGLGLVATSNPALAGKWQAPRPVAELNTAASEFTVWISADGLTVLFGSDRAADGNGLDIYQAVRPDRGSPFGQSLRLQGTVNTTAGEIAPYLMPDGLELWFCTTSFQILRATRPELDQPFDTREQVALAASPQGGNPDVLFPVLPDDGLAVYFTKPFWPSPPQRYAVLRATRADADSPFGAGTLVGPFNLSAGSYTVVQSWWPARDGIAFVSLGQGQSESPSNIGEFRDDVPLSNPASVRIVPELAAANSLNITPTLPDDEREILFSSNRPGGVGDMDIWLAPAALGDQFVVD